MTYPPPSAVTLRQLLQGLTLHSVPATPVTGVACDSKRVRAGEVFIAVRGNRHDGHEFVGEAIQRGAGAVIVERIPGGHARCPVVSVEDTRRALAVIAARFYGEPATRLRCVGVTGTNGKTTTTYLLKAALEAAGHRVGLLGTVAYQIGQRTVPSGNTTPGALLLQQYLAQMVEQQMAFCVMEVSSHALDQGRIDGMTLDAAIFTNLGSDHLDYHHTREQYAAAKRRIFSYLGRQGHGLINLDDPYSETLIDSLPGVPLLTYGHEQAAQVIARSVLCNWQGTSFVVESPWGVFPIQTPLVGRHNLLNLTAATAACLSLGIAPSAIQLGLSEFAQVPGRIERIVGDTGVMAVIDFAHTADALRQVLLSLRELTRGRLIVVFGCGGDRDQTKRPVMGQLASLLSDYVVLTSDNPRSEDPQDIVHQIKAGFVPGFSDYHVAVGREHAIHHALSIARSDDVVLIAGKGHETYQIFRDVTVPFSDREVVEHWFTQSTKTVTVS